jgi:hypothetical protein
MKPIPDKAEVALEYPDKFYIGTFERSARFDAHLDQTGISLTLHRTGDTETRRSVHMHFHYALFADILRDLAKTVSAMPLEDTAHRETVREAARVLYRSLDERAKVRTGGGKKKADDVSDLTPEEEVLLLHVLE